MDLELEILKGPVSNSWAAEVSGGIREAEQFFLRVPAQRKIATTGRQKLRGEFRGLAAFCDPFDNRRRQECQANHAADVALADTFALPDFEHRSRPTGDQIVKPPAGARRRPQD